MNKKYKRALSILLAVALFFGICSCGKQPVVNEPEPSVSAEPTAKPTATPEPATTPEPTESPLQTFEIPDELWTGVTEGFTTQFEYDLDGDGQKETYIFGVAFNNVLHGMLITNGKIGIQEGDAPTRDPFPCVWKYEADGTTVVAEEFAALLSQSETHLFCLTDTPKTQPQVTELNCEWQGGIRIQFTDEHHGIWMFAVSAVLDEEVLCAAATTTIAVSGRPEPVLNTPATDPKPTTTLEPTTTPESTSDLFLAEDNIVDSTNDIIIDVYAFIEERNKTHEAVTRTTYSEAWYQTYAPDFHDTLDLVSKNEAELLLTTKQRGGTEECTKEDALKDVDLLFRLYKSLYGPYEYFGGDATFDAAKNAVIEEINAFTGTLTISALATILIENLAFIKDRHTSINNCYLTEYHKINVSDYYVKDIFFYEDDVGYYTKKYDRKWYLKQVGSDQNIAEYLKLTIDENGQLCYMLGLSVTTADVRLKNKDIVLVRGMQEASQSIKWSKFEERAWEKDKELVTISGNNIPFLEIDQISEEYDAQNERVRQMGSAMLSQDVFILDANSGCGWQSLFESIPHSESSVYLYKLSNVADYIGRWNMPWNEGSLGEYYAREFHGRWGENNTLVFAVQDTRCYSAQEGTIADIRAIENVITVGGSTGGTAGPGGSTNSHLHLPSTGLHVQLGASLSITAGYTEEGYCIEPDIWVNPTDAVDAIYRLCNFYGIENTADTSVLNKYQSPHDYE